MRYRVAKKIADRLNARRDEKHGIRSITFYTGGQLRDAILALRRRWLRDCRETYGCTDDYFRANHVESILQRLLVFFQWRGRGRLRDYVADGKRVRHGHRYFGMPYTSKGILVFRKGMLPAPVLASEGE